MPRLSSTGLCRGWPRRRGAISKSKRPSYFPNRNIDDSVSEEIASPIREDFQEVKRCFAMFRRVVQVSAISLGASAGKRLVDQIDEITAKQIITPTLQRFAHEIRSVGNAGAHPSEDLDEIDEERKRYPRIHGSISRTRIRNAQETREKESCSHIQAVNQRASLTGSVRLPFLCLNSEQREPKRSNSNPQFCWIFAGFVVFSCTASASELPS